MWSFKFDVIVLSMTKNIYIYVCVWGGGEGGSINCVHSYVCFYIIS